MFQEQKNIYISCQKATALGIIDVLKPYQNKKLVILIKKASSVVMASKIT